MAAIVTTSRRWLHLRLTDDLPDWPALRHRELLDAWKRTQQEVRRVLWTFYDDASSDFGWYANDVLEDDALQPFERRRRLPRSSADLGGIRRSASSTDAWRRTQEVIRDWERAISHEVNALVAGQIVYWQLVPLLERCASTLAVLYPDPLLPLERKHLDVLYAKAVARFQRTRRRPPTEEECHDLRRTLDYGYAAELAAAEARGELVRGYNPFRKTARKRGSRPARSPRTHFEITHAMRSAIDVADAADRWHVAIRLLLSAAVSSYTHERPSPRDLLAQARELACGRMPEIAADDFIAIVGENYGRVTPEARGGNGVRSVPSIVAELRRTYRLPALSVDTRTEQNDDELVFAVVSANPAIAGDVAIQRVAGIRRQRVTAARRRLEAAKRIVNVGNAKRPRYALSANG
jgi:hypothetical protein